jgi:spore maturation protein CgeB
VRVIVAGTDYFGYIDKVARGFQQIGCTALVIPYDRPLRTVTFRQRFTYVTLPHYGISYFLDNAWRKIRQQFMRELLQHDFDLLIILRPDLLTPELIAEIRQKRPHALLTTWLTDPVKGMPDLSHIYPLFDHIFAYNAADLPQVRQWTPNAHTLLAAYDPQEYQPLASSETLPTWKLSFVGVQNPHRLHTLEQLCGHLALTPQDVRIYTGKHTWYQRYRIWRNQNRSWLYRRRMIIPTSVNAQQACHLYQHSTLSLNIHRVDAERGYNMRVFEIAGAGGFQLVDRVPGLDELFEEGREIEIYDSTEALLDKADYYLSHPQARQKIAQQAQRRAAAHHTFAHRASTILSLIDL